MPTQDGHKVRITMFEVTLCGGGDNLTYTSSKSPMGGRCEVTIPTQGENAHTRWMQGENCHVRLR